MGRKAVLEEGKTLTQIIENLKQHLKMEYLRVVKSADHTNDKLYHSIAVCAGSGYSVLSHAGKVDLWITGEMSHHEALDAQENNTTVLLAEHSNTERGFLQQYQQYIMSNEAVKKKNIEFKVSDV